MDGVARFEHSEDVYCIPSTMIEENPFRVVVIGAGESAQFVLHLAKGRAILTP